ncbi:hypothetical protein M0R04_15385 [Candidatus Dojkabacteria bacterium]|jgi:hypothetical protein|nr:hypothetical protein [Candidatus Dojkabacteria bacterium]
MKQTNFPGGVSSLGAPVLPYKAGIRVPNGGSTLSGTKHFWVHGNLGGDGNDGLSPDAPFLTMAAAFAQVGSGDIIHLNGKITEQLTTPAGVFDVTVIGEGTRPRHPDAHTSSNGYSGARWSGSGLTAATANVRVIQQGWVFSNILFDAVDANAACIELVRNSGSGDAERDASHASIIGNRFSGAGKGIRAGATSFTEVVNHVLVEGNRFDTMTYGIHTAIISNYWTIRDNEFRTCTNNIVADLGYAFIYNNIMGAFTTDSINLAGSSAGANMVTKNYLSGTYSSAGGYTVSAAGDEWAGNFNTLTGGITVADPA